MNRKPLIIDTGDVKQLQPGDELDIPLEDRFAALQSNFRKLVFWLAAQGFELPEDLLIEAFVRGD